MYVCFFFQAEDGIRVAQESRGLGDVYKRQDVDGTLIDSMWIWKQVDIEFLGKRGIPLPERLQMEIEGMSYSETAVYFKERFNLPESLEEIKEEWRLMAEDYYKRHIQLKSGAKDFLKLLYDKGLTLGIATSNSRELVDLSLIHI
mgnify:CR=1 FL=1